MTPLALVAPVALVSGWLVAAACLGLALVLAARRRRTGVLVAEAGHEVRGALTAVRLGLESPVAQAGWRSTRPAAAVFEIERATRALDDLSAAASGHRSPDRAELVDLGDVLRQAVDGWRPVARSFGSRLRVEAVPGTLLVHGDRVRLLQACGNLVVNALEHGRGPVLVRAAPAGGRVRIEVTDAGPGLPAPLPELIARGGAGAAARGHGLAVAAGVAERHGGRLVRAGGPGVVLELPLAAASRPAGRGRPEATSGSARRAGVRA